MRRLTHRNQYDDVHPRERAESTGVIVVMVELCPNDPYHPTSRPVNSDPRYPHWRLKRRPGKPARQVTYAPHIDYVREQWPSAIKIVVAAAPDHTLEHGIGGFLYPEWFNARSIRIQDTPYW